MFTHAARAELTKNLTLRTARESVEISDFWKHFRFLEPLRGGPVHAERIFCAAQLVHAATGGASADDLRNSWSTG